MDGGDDRGRMVTGSPAPGPLLVVGSGEQASRTGSLIGRGPAIVILVLTCALEEATGCACTWAERALVRVARPGCFEAGQARGRRTWTPDSGGRSEIGCRCGWMASAAACAVWR